jgi:F-type H+-transporting ATPase subunit c
MDASTALAFLQSTLAQAEAGISGGDMRMMVGVGAAAFAIAFGVMGAALGAGFATARACESIGRNPQAAGSITRTMLVGVAMVEATAIYALLIALLILVVAR